ncbi:MAG: flagellar hook-basal body complex protein [Tissierellales bacterium]|nr:flagellar hook-basal body complex protein [Tissierellales bacterium]
MLRSLYSGVNGMKGFQTKMDVIANNIANVNTTAFKSSRVRFQDMLSQTMSNAQSPSANGLGGINGKQVGLGVKVGAIDMMMTDGALQPTNRGLDFAIEGEGFFVVSPDSTGNTKYYTRDGAFFTDYEGNLVNSNGERVLGYTPTGLSKNQQNYSHSGNDALDGVNDLGKLKPMVIPEKLTVNGNTVVDLESFSIDGSGNINGVYSNGNSYILGKIGVVGFKNPEGLEKIGNNNYVASNNSGLPEAGTAGEKGLGVIRQGFLEMSNVDLANEFTEMIIASRAYQANSRSITTSDEMLQELINLKR